MKFASRAICISFIGNATLFIGVTFGGTEFFRNPVINSGLSDKLFEVANGE